MSSTQTGNTMQMEGGGGKVCFQYVVLCIFVVEDNVWNVYFAFERCKVATSWQSLWETFWDCFPGDSPFTPLFLQSQTCRCISYPVSAAAGLWTFSPYSSFWWTRFLSFLLMTPVVSFSSGTATPQALRNMWLMHKLVHNAFLQSILVALQSTRPSFEPMKPI